MNPVRNYITSKNPQASCAEITQRVKLFWETYEKFGKIMVCLFYHLYLQDIFVKTTKQSEELKDSILKKNIGRCTLKDRITIQTLRTKMKDRIKDLQSAG